jgi:predicted kinase
VNTLYITCGVPGSGKTTWAKEKGGKIISPEAIKTMFYGGQFVFDESLDDMIIFITETCLSACLEKQVRRIIIDDENLSRKQRCRYINMATDRGYNSIIAYFPYSQACISRIMNNARGYSNRIWSKVIEKARYNIDIPEPHECDIETMEY